MDEDDKIERLRRSTEQTPNHSYPTFSESGPSETLGQIGRAFTDIDQRIDGVTGELGDLAPDDINGVTDTGKALMTAESEEAAREAIGAGTSDFSGSFNDLTDRPASYPPAAHQHEMTDIVGLQDALDAKADQTALDQAVETLNETVSTTKGELEAEIGTKLDADANAVSASKLETPFTLTATGDVNGSTEIDGSKGVDLAITMAPGVIPTASTLEGVTDTGRLLMMADDVADAVAALGLSSVYNYRGQVESEAALPPDAKLGDVYNTADTNMNFAWNGTQWDPLGEIVTLESLGVTVKAGELNMTAGVTSNIQAQLDAKQNVADAFSGRYGDLQDIPSTFAPKQHTHTMEEVIGLDGALDAKADLTAIADMETKAHAAETYQPKGDYATKTEMTDALALKQDAATAFDGKYTSLTEVPTEFTPKHHTHVKADITDLDLTQYANYEIAMDHVITIDSNFATTAIGMKAGVYLVTDGADLPAELQEFKANAGFEGALTGYLHLFDYMPDGSRHDHLALLQVAIRSTDGSKYASAVFVFDGPQNKWMMQKPGIDGVNGLQAALDGKVDDAEIADMETKTHATETFQPKGDYAVKSEVTDSLNLKADKTAIADMLTRTEAASTYQPLGDYATKTEVAAKADKTAIADMLTKTEAAGAYQPKGDYVTTEQIADMETKANVAATYATKTEMTEGLAAKQNAADAFDGKYTSLTEVPSQFTPAAHTHVMADITDLQGALDAKADTSAIPTIPGNATASKAGLMSAEDKSKLDGLNNYVLPEATADVLGGVKVGAGLQIQDGKLTTATESKTFSNPDVIGSGETLDLSTATNGVYSIAGGSITGLTGSNETAAALVINAGATHPSALAFDGAFATDKVLPVSQDGTTWFKLTAMDRAEFVADPVGDTVTKEEFIAFRDALVAAGIMKPQA